MNGIFRPMPAPSFWLQPVNLLVLVALLAMMVIPVPSPTVPSWAFEASTAALASGVGKIPLFFIPNQGQADPQIAFSMSAGDQSLFFTQQGVTLVQATGLMRHVVKLDFVMANLIQPVGEEQLETIVSYFKGTPEQWQAGLPTFGRIVYHELWPGIDMAFVGAEGGLKYEFLLRPGADPSSIRLAYRGAFPRLNATGSLEVQTRSRMLGKTLFVDQAPVAFQEIAGVKTPVRASFLLHGDSYGFLLGAFDLSLPLVIDPALIFSGSFIGGSSTDYGQGVALDAAGNAYVTGMTNSTEATFPETVGPDLTTNGSSDAFVAKVNAAGTSFVYVGFLGGSLSEFGNDIAVDANGYAYVTGYTYSNNFPALVGPDLTYNGEEEVFIAKVETDGTGLVYAGYLRGASDEEGYAIAVDPTGHAVVVGLTYSTESSFPVLVGPDLTHNGPTPDPDYNEGKDAFVAKVAADGSGFIYCGYIGGAGEDWAYGVAVDLNGNAYVGGTAQSDEATFPVAVGPDLSYNGGSDAFLAKVSTTGASLVYAGFIGGNNGDGIEAVVVDADGYAYVAGDTDSTQATFPDLIGPDLTYNGGYADGFVAKVAVNGASLVFCGYIGGSGVDRANGIGIDKFGNAYLSGFTESSQATFPVLEGPDLTFNGGAIDIFIAKVKSDGSALLYSGYIGGNFNDWGYDMAVDPLGNAVVTGYTESDQTTFPVAIGPDLTHNGDQDAFLVKIVTNALFLPIILK